MSAGILELVGFAFTVLVGLIGVYVSSKVTDREHAVRIQSLESWRGELEDWKSRYQERIDQKLDAIYNLIIELKNNKQ